MKQTLQIATAIPQDNLAHLGITNDTNKEGIANFK